MLTGVSRRRDPRSRRRPSATSPLMTVLLDIRRSLLRQYGNFALAYSVTFQPGLEHFGDESGFLSYKTVGSTALVLSNPIAAPDKRRTLINRFMEEKGDLCFWQISRPVAEILASLGFSINEIGTESHINLANYNFTGSAPAKRNLRRAYNRTLDRGYTTRECPVASLNLKELEAVSVKWRQTRCVKSREITFLVRPAVLEDEVDVRKFFTFDRDGQLKAFAFFDPVYEGGEVVGYLCSTRRRLPETDPLVGYAQMRYAMESFQQEGKRYLFLGLSPLANIEDKEFIYNWLVRCIFRFAYANALVNRFLYPVQQLTKHKRAFGGTVAKSYYAFNRNPSLPRLIKVLRACTLI
jgi:lysylphosphatidylglycerol synthetase-like protein (DUF2156 family)